MMNDERGLNGLANEAHETARSKGFWSEGRTNIGEKLMMVVGEVSEAHDEYRAGYAIGLIEYEHTTPAGSIIRNRESMRRYEDMYGAITDKAGKPVGFPIELADIIIRTLDLAGGLGIDIEEAMRIKMDYNTTRPHMHGGKIV